MSRLTRTLLLCMAVALATALAVVLWTSHRPPRVARILPESDAILYADLKPARLATHFERSAPARSLEFQAFVDATGIVPERDLDEVAFGLIKRPDPAGPNGPVAYTEAFRGHFDASRLTRYLRQKSAGEERYASHDIYTLPASEAGSTEPRTLRVVILAPGEIAVSNAPTAEQIHVVVDRDRAGLLGATTPSLLAEWYPEVPALSAAWGIGSLGLPFAESGHVALLGLDLPLPADQPMIASLRYLGVLRLRIAAVAPTPELAMQQTGALTSMVGVARALGVGHPSPGPVAAALDSIAITRSGSRTVITADLPTDLLRQIAMPR